MFPPVAILRPSLRSEPKQLLSPEQYLRAKYDMKAKDAHWPEKASCVTAVRQILKHQHDTMLPHLWMNDFPAILTKYFSWNCHVVEQFKPGDLIFFHHTKRDTLSHMAIAVDTNRVFHCGYPKGPEIIPFTELVKQQAQKHKQPVSDPQVLLSFRDTDLYGRSHYLHKAILDVRGESAFEPP